MKGELNIYHNEFLGFLAKLQDVATVFVFTKIILLSDFIPRSLIYFLAECMNKVTANESLDKFYD